MALPGAAWDHLRFTRGRDGLPVPHGRKGTHLEQRLRLLARGLEEREQHLEAAEVGLHLG